MRALLLVVAIVGCEGAPKGTNALFPQKDDPDNLRALLDTIVKASESGDLKTAGALVRGLLPDAAALKKAFRDDVPAEVLATIRANIERVPADDAALAGGIRRGDPTQTQINVHGATTEEIQGGSTRAAGEFPGGAKEKAVLLRPGFRFYEAELVAPGEDLGMKYHLFFWDGSQWRMLGPIWRSLE